MSWSSMVNEERMMIPKHALPKPPAPAHETTTIGLRIAMRLAIGDEDWYFS